MKVKIVLLLIVLTLLPMWSFATADECSAAGGCPFWKKYFTNSSTCVCAYYCSASKHCTRFGRVVNTSNYWGNPITVCRCRFRAACG